MDKGYLYYLNNINTKLILHNNYTYFNTLSIALYLSIAFSMIYKFNNNELKLKIS